MPNPVLALKIDVDTERGTRIGVPNLVALLKELKIPATFYLSLGPDNTGRAIKRIFRRGFLQKVNRTSVISTYGLRTVLNGVLLPGPHIGKKHAAILDNVKQQGFEVGIHAYDHEKWQDGVTTMSLTAIQTEFQKAVAEFQRIFGETCQTAAAPGWQANAKTLTVYDYAKLTHASDCRGTYPFFPKIGDKVFHALQIPTTLPTLDELVGRPEFPIEKLTEYYFSLLVSTKLNVLTLHAELEGMKYIDWFRSFLIVLQQQEIQFKSLGTIAHELLAHPQDIPVCAMIQAEVAGRSGTLALQQV